MYLTREQAAAKLGEPSADTVLDQALRMYPQAVRTNFHMVTGYAKGTIMDAWYPGNPGIPEDMFTVSNW